MKVLSLATRMGLLALGMILVSVLSADSVWANASEDEPSTSGLADALLTDWALPLLILGVLMSMAMIGAAYLLSQDFPLLCSSLDSVERSLERTPSSS